jgi:hypothetical protein
MRSPVDRFEIEVLAKVTGTVVLTLLEDAPDDWHRRLGGV